MNTEGIHRVVILLGSNMGNSQLTIDNTCFFIEEKIGEIILASSIYETKAWGMEKQADFLNKVIICSTNLSPDDVLTECLRIEKKLGRERIEKWGSRIIDIDILYFDTEIIATKTLKVPHPYIQDRKFTLIPLCEIMADYIHPVFNVSNSALLERCQDELTVMKY